MADKQVSQLPQVGSIRSNAKFVLEQDGTAYHATAEQVGAMAPRMTNIDLTNLTEDFNGGSVTYKYEDGSTATYTQGIDAEGNATLTSGNHVITLKGLI